MADTQAEELQVAFDRQSMLERVDGDEEVMELVLGVFVEDAPLSMGALKQALESGDASQLRLSAHALKGAAANISAEELRSAAHDLEMIGESADLTGAAAAVVRVENAMNRVMPILEKMVAGK